MKVRFEIECTVDEEALAKEVAENGGNKYPCTVDLDDWRDVDLEAAWSKGIIEDVEITDYEEVVDE